MREPSSLFSRCGCWALEIKNLDKRSCLTPKRMSFTCLPLQGLSFVPVLVTRYLFLVLCQDPGTLAHPSSLIVGCTAGSEGRQGRRDTRKRVEAPLSWDSDPLSMVPEDPLSMTPMFWAGSSNYHTHANLFPCWQYLAQPPLDLMSIPDLLVEPRTQDKTERLPNLVTSDEVSYLNSKEQLYLSLSMWAPIKHFHSCLIALAM